MKLAAEIAIAFAALLLFTWAMPDLQAWLRPVPLVKCPPPAELEQLYIVVVRRGQSFEADCMTIVPRSKAK